MQEPTLLRYLGERKFAQCSFLGILIGCSIFSTKQSAQNQFSVILFTGLSLGKVFVHFNYQFGACVINNF